MRAATPESSRAPEGGWQINPAPAPEGGEKAGSGVQRGGMIRGGKVVLPGGRPYPRRPSNAWKPRATRAPNRPNDRASRVSAYEGAVTSNETGPTLRIAVWIFIQP